MAARRIIVIGDPGLNSPIPQSLFANQVNLAIVINDLKDTMFMLGKQCAGLAANQIGRDLRICITKYGKNYDIMINPMLVMQKGKFPSLEGCYSIPGYRAIIPRARTISVYYSDINGKSKFISTSDEKYAAVIQHEIDHLDGILISDYVNKEKGKSGGILVSQYDKTSTTAEAYISQSVIWSQKNESLSNN